MVRAVRLATVSAMTPSAVHAALRAYLEQARRALIARDATSDKRIHAARKSLKRARASLRLLREAIGKSRYDRENGALKRAARPLSQARDAEVALQTLAVLARDRKLRPQRQPLRLLRHDLTAQRDSARQQLQKKHTLRRCVTAIEASIRRIERWRLRRADPALVGAGLKKLYRKSRKAYAGVPAVDNDLALHECRRRTKYLWYALELLPARKREFLHRQIRQASAAADLLGDDHDLMLLRQRMASPTRGRTGIDALLERTVKAKRQRLQRKALRHCRELYRRKSPAFVKRALPRPQPPGA